MRRGGSLTRLHTFLAYEVHNCFTHSYLMSANFRFLQTSRIHLVHPYGSLFKKKKQQPYILE